jgi:hypothetical protein
MKTTHCHGLRTCALFLVTATAVAGLEAQTSMADKLHGHAVESFRQGRFPEAYGRFIALADAGHPASAKYALWMCEHGPALFGKDWDCAPHEIEEWARTARVAVPHIGPRHYVAASSRRQTPRR